MTEPGFYVGRIPARGSGSKITIESRPFRIADSLPSGLDPREYARERADEWCGFIQDKNPKDSVFVFEIPAPAQKGDR